MITLESFDLTTREGVQEFACAVGHHIATRTMGPALARIPDEFREVFIAFLFAEPLGAADAVVGRENFETLSAAWLAAMKDPASRGPRTH